MSIIWLETQIKELEAITSDYLAVTILAIKLRLTSYMLLGWIMHKNLHGPTHLDLKPSAKQQSFSQNPKQTHVMQILELHRA